MALGGEQLRPAIVTAPQWAAAAMQSDDGGRGGVLWQKQLGLEHHAAGLRDGNPLLRPGKARQQRQQQWQEA